MLVSHRHRFIYLKTIKTAGTAVEFYFEPFCVPDGADHRPRAKTEAIVTPAGIVGRRGPDATVATWYSHMPATLLRERLGEPCWSSYLKFCVVRDPFEKAISTFWYRLPPEQRDALAEAPFEQVRATFLAWLGPQKTVTRDRRICAIDGSLAVDRLLRHESLLPDLEALCAELGLPWEAARLQSVKAGFRRRPEPAGAYYDTTSVERLAASHAWEIATFNYAPRPAGWTG